MVDYVKAPQPMHIHRETFLSLAELGSQIPRYQPTYAYAGEFINESHRYFSVCPIRDGILIDIKDRQDGGAVIQGWLQREDSLKLYEMAYFAQGDILELGSYHGLGTSILARANHDAPRKQKIYSVDLDAGNIEMARKHLAAMGLTEHVTIIAGDATTVVRSLAFAGRKFGFVFVDHSHAFYPVYKVCLELHRILLPGGFCFFHDFNDERNRENSDGEYGVYQAVVGALRNPDFEFYGLYGCAALYRFNQEPPRT
jgi:predicted O-methyltransferase YrrM